MKEGCFWILVTLIFSLNQSFAQDTLTSAPENPKKETELLTFKKNKFSFGDIKDAKIEKRFLGLVPYGYTKVFKQTIERNPYAGRILKRSYQYQAIETSSTAIAWGLVFRSAFELVTQIKNVSNDDIIPGNTTMITDNTFTVISFGFAIYGGSKKQKYIKLAIEEFNNQQ